MLQEFVRTSGYAPFTHLDNRGHWKQLTLRTNREGDIMAWIILHPQDMPPEERSVLSDKVKDHFSAEKSAGSLDKPLASLYIQFMGQKQRGSHCNVLQFILVAQNNSNFVNRYRRPSY